MVNFHTLRQQLENIPFIQGISPVDVLALPNSIGKIIRKMTRENCLTIEQIADELDLGLDEAKDIADLLVDKGYLKSETQQKDADSPLYRVYYARMRKRNIPLDL